MIHNFDKHLKLFSKYATTHEEELLLTKLKNTDLSKISADDVLVYNKLRDIIVKETARLSGISENQDSLDKALELTKALDEFETFSRLNELVSADWESYVKKIEKIKRSGELTDRLEVLSLVKQTLDKDIKFSQLSKPARYLIGGNHTAETRVEYNNLEVDAFGSMKGAGKFIGLLNKQAEVLDETIASIPCTGTITKAIYLNIVNNFKTALQQADVERNYLAPLTRLLTVIRPDYFVCLTDRNKTLINELLNIKKILPSDYERYWDDVVVKLQQLKWSQVAEPADEMEKKIWHARIALLDMFFYEPEEITAVKSQVKGIKVKKKRNPDEARQIMSDFWKNNKSDFTQFVQNNIKNVRSQLIELLVMSFDAHKVFEQVEDLINGASVEQVANKLRSEV